VIRCFGFGFGFGLDLFLFLILNLNHRRNSQIWLQDLQILRIERGRFQPHPSHQRIRLSQHHCLRIKQIFYYHHSQKWPTFNQSPRIRLIFRHHRQSQKLLIFRHHQSQKLLIFKHHRCQNLLIFYSNLWAHLHHRRNQISPISFRSNFFANPFCL
jgi:hypothetical protein